MDDDVCEPVEEVRAQGPTSRVTFLLPTEELKAIDEARLSLPFPPTRTAFIRACIGRGMKEVTLLASKDWPT